MTDGQDEQTWLDEIIEMKRVKNRTIIESERSEVSTEQRLIQ